MTDIQEFVLEALRNTPQDQLDNIINQRTSGHPAQAGSVFNPMYVVTRKLLEEFIAHDTGEVTDEVRAAGSSWKDCRYFQIPIGGTLGVVPTWHLDWDGVLLRLVDPKGDLGTDGGCIQAVYDGRPPRTAYVTYTTLVVGHDEAAGEPWNIWTMFPGDAVKLSEITDRSLLGKKVTVDEARALGFETVKLTRLK